MKASCLAVIAACCWGGATTACEPPRLALGSSSETQPRLTWMPAPSATAYRVRVQSRVPDGRVIATHDTIVSAPEFRPPAPLAEHRAKVTVRVNAVCGPTISADSAATFTIDTSPLCKLGEVEAARNAGAVSLRWQPVDGARGYEVRGYGLLDGRLLASRETRDTAAQLALEEPVVVSVRPACAAGLGEAVYRVLAR